MIEINMFRVKVKILLFLNRLVRRCRMYDRRPASPTKLCEVCARRGGFSPCRRPRSLMVKGDGCGGPFHAEATNNIKTGKFAKEEEKWLSDNEPA